MESQSKKIIKQYKDSCNELAGLVNMQLFDGCRKWYWIGDEVGGACDFEECDVLNPKDMVRIIENGLTYDEYAEWREVNIDNNRYINLKSWLWAQGIICLREKITDNKNICDITVHSPKPR